MLECDASGCGRVPDLPQIGCATLEKLLGFSGLRIPRSHVCKVPGTLGAPWRAAGGAPFGITITTVVLARGPGGQAKPIWLGQAPGLGGSLFPLMSPTPPPTCSSQRKWGLLQASQSGLGAGPQHPPLISRVTWQPKGKLSTPLRSGQIWLEPGTHGDQGCSGQSGIPPPRLAL